MTQKELKKQLTTMAWADLQAGLLDFDENTPTGVRNLYFAEIRRREKEAAEQQRLYSMLWYEREYENRGFQAIAGVDEAGRGPMAGPVVTAAVIMPYDDLIPGVNDSKKLSAKKREELYPIILEKALAYGVTCVGPEVIDEINILQATLRGMRESVQKLQIPADCLLLDAVHLGMGIQEESLIGGDAKSYSIACASILAKVTRDRIMEYYDKKYPQYGFSGHKGYGTAAHMVAIRTYGLSPIHRKSFHTR